MKRLVTLLIVITLLTGCSSLKFKNIVKTSATTGVTYAIAGPIPAIANIATSITVDEIIPDEPNIDQIESKEQAVAFVAQSWGTDILYAFIAFLLITNVIVPWFTKRRGYNQAKGKYKNVEFKSDMKL